MLTLLAKRANWESVAFAGFDEDGSGELDLHAFSRMARHKMGLGGGRLSDGMLRQLFRRIDERGSGRIDAATLKLYLLNEELRQKVRVGSSVVDWTAAFAQLASSHCSSPEAYQLDVHEFFVVVRCVQHRRLPYRQSSVLGLKLTDDEVVSLFRAVDVRGTGLICAKDLDSFFTGASQVRQI